MLNNALIGIAQLWPLAGRVLAADVPRLPGSPLLDRFVFEEPWISSAMLIALGVAAWYALRNHERRAWRVPALLIGLSLAVVNIAVALIVTTPRERCIELTRNAVEYVVMGDAASLGPMLRSDLVVRPLGYSRDRVLDRASTVMRGEYAVKDHQMSDLSATQDSENAIRTQVRVRATPTNGLYAYPIGSWWILTWQKAAGTSDTWVITQIECQQIDGVSDVGSLGVR